MPPVPLEQALSVDFPDGEDLPAAVRPSDYHPLDPLARCVGTQAEGDLRLELREVAPCRFDLPPLQAGAGGDLHSGAYSMVVRCPVLQPKPEPEVPSLLIVSEQPGAAVDPGEDNVRVAVAVDVGVGGASADKGVVEVAGALVCYLDEPCWSSGSTVRARTGVPEELRGLTVGLGGVDLLDVGLDVAVGL